MSVKAPLAASSGGGSAVMAATVAGLGAGTDGRQGVIRIGTAPDVEYVELTYDATAGKWTSAPRSLIFMTDLTYMGVNGTTYGYISTNDSGSASGGIGWGTKPVRRAAELYTAGLKLQVEMAAIVHGSTVPATITVMPRFFLNADGSAVTFSSDGSTALGEVVSPIVSPSSNTVTFKSQGWQDVVALGGSTPLSSANVTAANLWPRLYAKISSGTTFGGVIDFTLNYRWVG